MTKRFTSPAAFKASLEARLRTRATALTVPFQTLQLKFVMERLVARLSGAQHSSHWRKRRENGSFAKNTDEWQMVELATAPTAISPA